MPRCNTSRGRPESAELSSDMDLPPRDSPPRLPFLGTPTVGWLPADWVSPARLTRGDTGRGTSAAAATADSSAPLPLLLALGAAAHWL